MSERGHRGSDPAPPGDDPEGDASGHPHLPEAVERIEEVAHEVADEVVDPAGRFRWKRGDTARVVIAALALLACWIAASGPVSSAERTVFEAINGAPAWLYPIVWPPMQLGNVSVAVALAIGIGIVVGRPRLGLLAAAAAVAAWVLAKVVKEQVRRGRPDVVGLDVVLRGPAEDGFGFISGHSTVAFAVAAVVAPHLRRPWNRVVLGLAVVVGVARVVVGVHLPLDVVGGAACGLLVGEVVRLVEVATRPGAGRSRQRA